MPAPPTLYAKTSLPRGDGLASDVPLVGGHLALDLLNSTPAHGVHHVDDLLAPGYVNLLDWAAAAGAIDFDLVRPLMLLAGKEPREAAAVRRRAIALRGELQPVIQSLTQGAATESRLPVLNTELTVAGEARELVLDGGYGTWRWKRPRALERPLWELALAAADLLLHADRGKLRQCAAPTCQRYFLDTSRNGLRRYCSPNGCGTVERVRRFRERHRQNPSSTD
jgi:predicted RNA-binding Zn ribbon-like protein